MRTEMNTTEPPAAGTRSLSVVLLCFNDGAIIDHCIEQAYSILGPVTRDLQVIVIEDGSSDNSRLVLQELMARFPALEVIYHERNLGYGRSLSDGVHAARNQYVLCSDGDNQFDFKDALRLLEFADGRYEIISGWRRPRADPWYRCVLGWLYNRTVRLMFGLQLQDVDCGFKLLNRRAARLLFPVNSNLAVWVEAMAKAERYEYRSANLKVHHRPRQNGQSTVFHFSGLVRFFGEIIALCVRFKLLRRLPERRRLVNQIEVINNETEPLEPAGTGGL